MKFVRLALLLISFSVTSVQADLLEDITDGKFRPRTIHTPRSMNDGEHYTLLTDNQTIVQYNYKTGEAVDTLLSLRKEKNAPLKSISGYILDPKENRILVYSNVQKRFRRSFTANYYIFDRKHREFDPLSDHAYQESPVFSPDGRYIAFSHANNLYMKKVDFKTFIPITKDGEFGKIINGTSDWLYEEEFGITHLYSWSPDSKLLAYVKFDESQVPEFSFQRYMNAANGEALPYPESSTFKYPKAGAANAKVSVCIYDDFNKTTRVMELNETMGDYYIPRIKWTQSADQLAIFQLNRNQNQLDMYLTNPRSGISKLILRQTDKYYVDYELIDHLTFTSNNASFYNVSEQDGYRHIYEHSMDGRVLRQLTKGNWDVTDFYGVDEARKLVYYQAAAINPMQREVYVVNSRAKTELLSPNTGTSSAWFSSNFQYFIQLYSDLNTPNQYSLLDAKGKTLRTLEQNTELGIQFKSLALNQKEFFSFKTSEGVELNGWMLKPQDFDANKAYPVVMTQYSGPNSQEVLNRWGIGWEYYLSTQGYLVVSVDGRGTGARGAEFRKCTYQQMGVLESKDQVEAARYLGQQSYVDKNRIAIFGWSYGGSMTIWAMSTGDNVFKAGISVAPVTDWRFYDSAYTERFMRTPDENFKGYDLTSGLTQVDKLHGRLLLVHGTADDNVHFSNTLAYSAKLVEAGKQFEMQIYTDKDHSITGKQTRRHLYTRLIDFLRVNL